MRTPRDDGFVMAADWMRHGRYWMAWPSPSGPWSENLDAARESAAGLAKLVAEQGRVTMLANATEVADVSLRCGPGVGAMVVPHEDCSMRAIGPTFLIRPDDGAQAGVRWPAPGVDAAVSQSVIDHLGLPSYAGPVPGLGSMVVVDGEGTCLASEALLARAGRPRAAIEDDIAGWLGVDKVIWLRAGLDGDLSGGQILNLARFLEPGLVLAPAEDDDSDAAAPILAENIERLKTVRDARNRRIEVVPVPQPHRRFREDGRPVLMSYANCFVDGNLVILPAFEDSRDQIAYDRVVGSLLDHTVISYPATDLAWSGGGVGSLILSQPGPAARPASAQPPPAT